jgi:hypothetical protein
MRLPSKDAATTWRPLFLHRLLLPLLLPSFLLAGCTTPYRPPVQVAGGASFTGLDAIIRESAGNPVDVILVHGMCTKTDAWAHSAVDAIMGAIEPGYVSKPGTQPPPSAADAIHIVHRDEVVRGVPVRFSGLIWSPLTAGLKHQLDFDRTGTATDCAVSGECRPKRARFNGMLKDGLLNDCLSDALIYQGDSRERIRQKMIDALDASFARQGSGPLILVTESLGSKITFDALNAMLEGRAAAAQVQAARLATSRLVQVFMIANQLPILGLADQVAGDQQTASLVPAADPLERFLTLRQAFPRSAERRFSELTVVALTDPNDLLSYRLLPSRYASAVVHVADVLVSNPPTYLGLLANPATAHTTYFSNPDVGVVLACGSFDRAHCK